MKKLLTALLLLIVVGVLIYQLPLVQAYYVGNEQFNDLSEEELIYYCMEMMRTEDMDSMLDECSRIFGAEFKDAEEMLTECKDMMLDYCVNMMEGGSFSMMHGIGNMMQRNSGSMSCH